MKQSKNDFFQKTIVVWAGALICCAMWGSAFPCIKLGYQWLGIDSSDTASQILFAGIRFTMAGMIAILIGSIIQRNILIPKKESVPKILWLSLLQTVIQYLFFYVGLAHTTGVKASIIEGMNVFIALLVAACIFRQEKLTTRKMLGCVIGFAGVVLVNLLGKGLENGLDLSLMGEGFIFFSTVSYAFSSVYLKKYSKSENPVVLSGYQFVMGGIIMMICGAAFGGNVKIVMDKGAGMLLWLAVVSAVAYSLWGILLKYNPVSKVAIFGFMNPVFGVVLSALLLAEGKNLGIGCVIALGLVSFGIYITTQEDREK